jgi:hypothetical protein
VWIYKGEVFAESRKAKAPTTAARAAQSAADKAPAKGVAAAKGATPAKSKPAAEKSKKEEDIVMVNGVPISELEQPPEQRTLEGSAE